MAIHAQNSVSLNTKPAKTSLLGGHFIYRVDTSQGTLTPSSANIIENVNDSPTLWGYNTHIGAGGIKLRYNQIDLSTWTKDGVTLYYPKYNSSNVPIQGDAAAILNTTGLKVQKGGVIAGTAGQNGFVYLSSEDYQLKDSNHAGFTINGHTPTAAGTDDKLIDDPAWREIIGTKFGVDSEGNLYASNANISGRIIATEGEIGGCTIDSNGHLIVPSAYVDGTLTVTTIEGGVFNTNNYIRLSSEDSQTTSIGNSGNKTDWRIIAGNTFGVDKAGNLYATSAHVNGEIEATTGLIGGNDGWHIGTSAIYSGSHSTYNTPNVNGIFLGKESSNYYISGGPGAKWWIKDDGTFQLGTSGISYDGSTVTFGSNVTMPTLTVDTITGGTAGQSGYTYLSKNDNGTNLDIAGSGNKSNWRLVVGTNFGVDNAGNLYASNASISGAITATSGTIGGCTIDANGRLQITDLNVTGKLTASSLNVSNLSLISTSMGTLTSGTITYGTVGSSQSFYLSNTNTTATINGTPRSGLRFTIGSKFGVDYNGNLYADGAYITNIDTSGITLSKIQSGSSNYAQISGSGLEIKVGGKIAANFGSTSVNFYNSDELNTASFGDYGITINCYRNNQAVAVGSVGYLDVTGAVASGYFGLHSVNHVLISSDLGIEIGSSQVVFGNRVTLRFLNGWTNYGNLSVQNASGTAVSLASVSWVQDKIDGASGTNTKNTAGTTSGSGNRLYLIGAQDISGNYAQTYVNNKAYISAAGNLYSGEQRVATSAGGTSGRLVQWSSSTYDLVNGPTVNGSAAAPSGFYAPTTAGTSGYILKSSGSGAPTWAAVTNKGATLAYNTTTTIATIAGTDIKVTMPAASGGSSSGVTSITTTKGQHTAISSSTGAVSFNVPGGTQHINKTESGSNGNAIAFANVSSGNGQGATLQYVINHSDIKLKENIIYLYDNDENIIKFYNSLHPVSYHYKPGVKDEAGYGKRYGFIAQDVKESLDNYGMSFDIPLVYESESIPETPIYKYAGPIHQNLDYDSFHALHVLYTRYLEQRITELENRILSIENN